VLIDCGPDFRTQALRSNISDIDAVLFTHLHASHLFGIDDLRVFTAHHVVWVYTSYDSVANLRTRFPYAFGGPVQQAGGGVPKFKVAAVDSTFVLDSIAFDPIPFKHGDENCYGYRFGNFAYLTDGNELPDDSYAKLAGVDLLVVNAIGPLASPAHFSFATALDAIERIKPRRAWFTHIGHDATHTEAEA
jgi:phosphoribosyl 1,2-cyclic phosphate phosphodiesterase